MDLSALKKSLHEKVERSTDLNVLHRMDFLLTHKDKAFKIPKEHLDDILQGNLDIKSGDFLTVEELEERYEKYLAD